MNGHERLEAEVNALEKRVDELHEWREGIDEERLLSRSQREGLLHRVGLLEKLQWGGVALVLTCVAMEVFKLIEKKP